MIAIQAGCHTAMIADVGPVPPFAETWMFNDLAKTVFAGVVGHMDGGWLRQHEVAHRFYLDAWRNLCTWGQSGYPDYPLDWIVLSAAEAARTQGLEQMEQYFMSAATMGAYVMAYPGGQCIGDNSVPDNQRWDIGTGLSAYGIPGAAPSLRFSVLERAHVRLRVYDVDGRHVSTLQDGVLRPGTYYKTWMGMNMKGEKMPSGAYFARLDVAGHPSEQVTIIRVR